MKLSLRMEQIQEKSEEEEYFELLREGRRAKRQARKDMQREFNKRSALPFDIIL